MWLESLRIAAAGALLILLPGFVILQACLPADRSSLSRPERAFLVIALGMGLVMAVGLVLGFLPHGKTGQLQTFASAGQPKAELSILGISAVLFYVGLARGAYPRLTERLPWLALENKST